MKSGDGGFGLTVVGAPLSIERAAAGAQMSRLLKKSYAPHFLISGTVLAVGVSFAAAPASYWLLNALCGIAALVGVWLVGIRLAYQSVSRTARRAWQVTLVLLLLVAIREFGGPSIAGFEESSGLDRLMDGLVLVTAFVCALADLDFGRDAALLAGAPLVRFPAPPRDHRA